MRRDGGHQPPRAPAVPLSATVQRAADVLAELVLETGGNPRGREVELVAQLVGTCVKLLRDRASISDVKIVNTALKELRYAFWLFAKYRHRRKVSCFGSARTRPAEREYRVARSFAEAISAAGFMVITGAGGGIMRACQEGAGRKHSFGVNIKLPFEQQANDIIERDEKLVTFKYFFTRKLLFIKEADAVVLFPGGFGTHDEAYESLTLVQTGKTDPMPIVFLDVRGGTYWKTWERYVRDHLLRRSLMSPEDMSLFLVTDDVGEAVAEITRFYRVYHSLRVVGRRTVLRLNHPISDALLARLNAEFKDILTGGEITQQRALPVEHNEPDLAHLTRLVLHFDREHCGRLRQMIDMVNRDG